MALIQLHATIPAVSGDVFLVSIEAEVVAGVSTESTLAAVYNAASVQGSVAQPGEINVTHIDVKTCWHPASPDLQ